MSASLPTSIPDSQLGLSASEIHLLRQHQQIALAAVSPPAHHHHHHHHGHNGHAHPQLSLSQSQQQQQQQQQQQGSSHSVASTRGRGHARTSASTSRATSAASSQQGGRLVLDAGSLAVLGQHFERLMSAIQSRVENLTLQTQLSTAQQSARAAAAMSCADAEIARFRDVLRQIDELEVEFDKVRHIRDIVKGFRVRVEGLEKGGRW